MARCSDSYSVSRPVSCHSTTSCNSDVLSLRSVSVIGAIRLLAMRHQHSTDVSGTDCRCQGRSKQAAEAILFELCIREAPAASLQTVPFLG